MKSEDGTGNNGVLQVLNNAILNLSTKDYINQGNVDLLEILDRGGIVIVDIEGIESDIHGVLLESTLSKLSARIRKGKPNPISIFIDEANRVLSSGMDLHNDTLRESNVELILAIQNEEQMIEKFGDTRWESIRKNFKHNYWIDLKHNICYNDQEEKKAKALLIDDTKLMAAEYAFNAQPYMRDILEERFEYTGELPSKFILNYNIVDFEKEQCIELIDSEVNKKEIEYIGKDLKQKLNDEMQRLGYGSPKIELTLNI